MNKKDREEIEYEVELRSTMEEFYKTKKTIAKILDKKKLEQDKKFLAYSKMLERAHMRKETLLELKEAHKKYIPLGQKSQEMFKSFFPEYISKTSEEEEEEEEKKEEDKEIFNKLTKMRKSTGISHLSPRKHELLQTQKPTNLGATNISCPLSPKSHTSISTQAMIIQTQTQQLDLIEKTSHISVNEDPLPSLEERISAIPRRTVSLAFPGQKNVIINQLESLGAENFYNYKGNYKNSHLYGIGKYWYIDGGSYDGYWVNDIPDGQGTAVYSDGSVYVGTFKNSLFHGYGVMNDSVGNKYDGHWVNGKRSGNGTITYNNGLIYNGMFVNDKMNGEGEMISVTTGFHYIGQWRNNKICGKGVLVNDHVENVKYERIWPEKSFHETIKDLKKEIIKRKKENEKKLYEISSYVRNHKLELYVESVRQRNKQIEEANKLRIQQMKEEEERRKKLLEDGGNGDGELLAPHPPPVPPPKPPSGPPPKASSSKEEKVAEGGEEEKSKKDDDDENNENEEEEDDDDDDEDNNDNNKEDDGDGEEKNNNENESVKKIEDEEKDEKKSEKEENIEEKVNDS